MHVRKAHSGEERNLEISKESDERFTREVTLVAKEPWRNVCKV